ncbi:hypothetical protein QJS04_geneDACA019107 [Acorus gramineus]|uniref:Uncharacterized protein n=1 Tax=Acorus gramineus TaxID=55184 RepID=A0AAV9A8H9_ACOGR|nr:hypothetical protein QJS04_geneDACA019107 [Acorus gramineus]
MCHSSLIKAAQRGDLCELRQTWNDDTLNATDPAGNTALHVAVMAGRDDFAKELCRRRPMLLMKENKQGNTPLHCALKSSVHNESLFKYFMQALSQVTVRRLGANRDGESLLYLAADRGSLESVNLLLQRGEPTDFVGPNGWTALHAAVFRRHTEIAEELLQNDPKLNHKKDASGNTPLHYAAGYDDIEMVNLILNTDEDVGYLLNVDGHSPLHVAAGLGQTTVVEALIERCPGCVTLRDNVRRNALHVAVEAGCLCVVELLLVKHHPLFNGLVRDQDWCGNTPLHLAAVKGDSEMLGLLLTAGADADANSLNHAGLTPRDIVDLRGSKHQVHFHEHFEDAFIKAGGERGPSLFHLKKLLKRNNDGEAVMEPIGEETLGGGGGGGAVKIYKSWASE